MVHVATTWIGKNTSCAEERYRIARERETPEVREERLRKNQEYMWH